MIIIPQVIAAFIVGICYYMLAVAVTVYDGVLSLIFQPIIGAILSFIVILPLLAVGLPIRLIKKINLWWKAHWWLALVLGAIAFAMICASWLPQFRVKEFDPELQQSFDSFNPVLAIGGWALTLFSVLHFYPPLPWRKQNLSTGKSLK